MDETWKAVAGFPHYEVSDLGRVRHVRYLRPTKARKGTGGQRYPHLNLAQGEASHSRSVHSLVAEAFLGPRPPGYTVDHKNFDRDDNRAVNLEYVTIDENIHRAIAAGVIRKRKPHHKNKAQFRHKLTQEQVDEIKRLLPELNMTEIAGRFGVSRELIRQIKIGKLWS